MRSYTDQNGSASAPQPGKPAGFALWNRKLHFYIGLYLLLFLWLFAFTGLLLNHPQWSFADFWPTRLQSGFERSILPPGAASDLDQARDLMRQLNLHGEIDWTVVRTNPERLDFRVSRPGHIFEVKCDLAASRAAVQRIDLNGWGIARLLHTFTGVRAQDERNSRDWVLTTIWAYTMDAVALGMILMTLGSLYMWWQQQRKRRAGIAALMLGTLCCGFFAAGLRWLF
jgi:hypothetical protein